MSTNLCSSTLDYICLDSALMMISNLNMHHILCFIFLCLNQKWKNGELLNASLLWDQDHIIWKKFINISSYYRLQTMHILCAQIC